MTSGGSTAATRRPSAPGSCSAIGFGVAPAGLSPRAPQLRYTDLSCATLISLACSIQHTLHNLRLSSTPGCSAASSPLKHQASMAPCHGSKPLTVPVTLAESSGCGVKILPCSVTASGTLSDLQTAIRLCLGSHDALTTLLYRGLSLADAQLSQPLALFASGGCGAPRFQAKYTRGIHVEVRTSTGQQLQQLFRPDITVKDAEEVKAAVSGGPLRSHRLCIEQDEMDETASPPVKKARTAGSQPQQPQLKRLVRGAKLASLGIHDGAVLQFLPYDGRDNIQIEVRTQNATAHHVRLDRHDDVTLLEGHMSRVLEESNRIRFMHQGQVLRPGWSLHSCDVQNESILDFLVEQFGGGGMTFADVGNAGAMTKLSFGTGGPRWRCCGTGLNVEGICTNAACKAHGRMIIDIKGLRSFNLQQDKACCPMCYKAVKPSTCAFIGCAWMYDGCKLDSEGQPEPCSSDWQIASHDGYHRFEEDGNTVEWESLVISARETSFAEDAPCPICWSQISSDKGYLTGCRHGFHKDCLSEWQQFSQGGRVSPVPWRPCSCTLTKTGR